MSSSKIGATRPFGKHWKSSKYIGVERVQTSKKNTDLISSTVHAVVALATTITVMPQKNTGQEQPTIG